MKSRQPFLSTLQPKVLAAVGGTCLVLFLGQLGVARSIIMRGYANLELEQAQTNAERLERSFARDIENLMALIRDWAVWDDTYQFVQTGDEAYIKSNLTSDTFMSLSLNLIAIFDDDGNLIYGQVSDVDAASQTDIPPELLAAITQHPDLLNRSLASPHISGFVRLNQIPMVLVSHAILTSTNEGPVQGSLIMGQYFGDLQLAELTETTRLPVDSFMYGADSKEWSQDVRAIAPTLTHQAQPTAVQVLNSEQIAAYARISDLSGQPAMILKTTSNREIYTRGQISLHYYFWSSLIIGAGFCLLILLLLRYLVLSRLEWLSQQVNQIGMTDLATNTPKPVQVTLSGHDEMAQLAQTINWALQQLHQRTAELQAAKQMAEVAKEAADGANQAKSTFLANMSHELRTPLNAILGFAQVLGRDRSLTSEQHEKIRIINQSGEHLLSLINDVLDMSKIEAEHIELHPSPFDLPYLLETLEDMLHLKVESKGITLTVASDPTVPQYIYGDSRKLQQSLINLLNNAIKFTTEGDVKLTVACLNPSPEPVLPGQPVHLQFSVADTGVGIAQDELPLLFEPFAQTESGRQAQQGTGLGLSISRKFVELMGGEITVNSQVGKGTTFTFDIWAEIADGRMAASAFAPQHIVIGLAPGQPSYRILVVDDRPLNRKLLIDLLGPIGFELREAENGQAAIAQWEAWQPHLIWMDMRMPVLNGYQATQQIKAQPQGQATIIIALTASTLEEEKAMVLSAGCDDFVRKPFQSATIFNKIAAHLGVRYLYDESLQDERLVVDRSTCDRTTNGTSHYSLPTSLAAMSPQWLQQLRQAAVQLNSSAIIALLDQLPSEYRKCQVNLQAKVNNFDFDQIVAIADAALAAQHPSAPSTPAASQFTV